MNVKLQKLTLDLFDMIFEAIDKVGVIFRWIILAALYLLSGVIIGNLLRGLSQPDGIYEVLAYAFVGHIIGKVSDYYYSGSRIQFEKECITRWQDQLNGIVKYKNIILELPTISNPELNKALINDYVRLETDIRQSIAGHEKDLARAEKRRRNSTKFFWV